MTILSSNNTSTTTQEPANQSAAIFLDTLQPSIMTAHSSSSHEQEQQVVYRDTSNNSTHTLSPISLDDQIVQAISHNAPPNRLQRALLLASTLSIFTACISGISAATTDDEATYNLSTNTTITCAETSLLITLFLFLTYIYRLFCCRPPSHSSSQNI